MSTRGMLMHNTVNGQEYKVGSDSTNLLWKRKIPYTIESGEHLAQLTVDSLAPLNMKWTLIWAWVDCGRICDRCPGLFESFLFLEIASQLQLPVVPARHNRPIKLGLNGDSGLVER